MSEVNNNFIKITDEATGEETYRVQFDYGTQKIDVKKEIKINIEFVHGGFEQVFSRVGNDLIIGDNTYYVRFQRLGVGFGKEVWIVSKKNNCYQAEVGKYDWEGSTVGYSANPRSVETLSMTEDELLEFQSRNNVTIQLGVNTLYTTWAVVPNPIIHYHMTDCGDYAPANGNIILKDYFLYGKNTVFVDNELLTDIIANSSQYEILLKSNNKRSYNIYDTFFSENLYGGDGADKIHSYMGDDTIEAGKGNDKIYLGEGNKTIVISQGDGKDTVYDYKKSDSLRFSIDTDNVYFTKSKNDLILNRNYYDDVEKTIINNYFKTDKTSDNIIVSHGDNDIISDFAKGLANGDYYLRASSDSKTIKGTDFSDEAYSSDKDETFILKKGNDIIHFNSEGQFMWSPYEFGKDTVKLTEGSHITLDFSSIGGSLSYEKIGNDAIITARHKIDICGHSYGKEEWFIRKGADNSYTVEKTEFYFTSAGYKFFGKSTEEIITKSELDEFEQKYGITLKTGKNTLYTSWAVVSNPEKHYSLKDNANYGTLLGSVRLKDYFKYNEDSVYVENKSLQEIFKETGVLSDIIDRSSFRKKQVIKDTFLDETIIGSKQSDKITSNIGDDTINAGKGDDTIKLGKGNKTVNIHAGDGKDTIIISKQNDSVNIVFDDEFNELGFTKSGKNLVISRFENGKQKKTIMKDFYKNNLENNIMVSIGDYYSGKLTKDISGKSWGIICEYPPTDNVETMSVNRLLQDINGWKSVEKGTSDIVQPIDYKESEPVLLAFVE